MRSSHTEPRASVGLVAHDREKARARALMPAEPAMDNDEERYIRVYELGTSEYAEAHALQQRLQAQRIEGEGTDALLLTEHEPVFTLGRSHPRPDLRVPAETVASYGISIIQTERGGDITYHGPGQLVAYGIIDLRAWRLGVLDYAKGLEGTVIGVLADWGIKGERVAGARGVWVAERKIASIGLNVRRWVTMHGIALNVDPEMAHFDLINACGMPDAEITSLSAEVNKVIGLDEVAESFIFHFSRVFACDAEEMNPRGKRRA